VYAPGVRVVNAYTTGHLNYEEPATVQAFPTGNDFDDPFCSWSGTSFAAPYVTGKIAARMCEYRSSAKEACDALVKEAAERLGPKDPNGDPIVVVT